MQKIIDKSYVLARLGLGGMLFAFGLASLLQLAPQPQLEGAAAQYMGGLAAAGYFFPLLKVTEVLVGLALLTNRFVPLALVVLAPITLHIVAFHAALAPAGIAPGLFILATHLAVAWERRAAFEGVLQVRPPVASPVAAPAPSRPAIAQAA